MIAQIALGFLLAAAVIFGIVVAPVFVISLLGLVLLFWFVLWLCTRERSNGSKASSGTVSAVFAVVTVFVMILVFAPARKSRSVDSGGLFIPTAEFPKAVAIAKAALPKGTSAVFCPVALIRHDVTADGRMALEFYHDEVTGDGSPSPRRYWRALFHRDGGGWKLESVLQTPDFSLVSAD